MSKRGDGELAARLAAVAERAAASVGSADAPLVAALAERYYAHVPMDDLLERDPGDLARTIVAHFEIARQREPGAASVHVWSPPASDGGPPEVSVVDIVTDDMPFLVDSVRMALNVGGALVSLVVHPQVRVTRDAKGGLVGIGEPAELTESFLHFEIGRQAGADALDGLRDDVRRVLGDVRAAVEDWAAMHERALDLVKTLEAEPPPLPKREVAEGPRVPEVVGRRPLHLPGLPRVRPRHRERRRCASHRRGARPRDPARFDRGQPPVGVVPEPARSRRAATHATRSCCS